MSRLPVTGPQWLTCVGFCFHIVWCNTKGVGGREILETYLNSVSKNTSETTIFPHGTISLLTSVIIWKLLLLLLAILVFNFFQQHQFYVIITWIPFKLFAECSMLLLAYSMSVSLYCGILQQIPKLITKASVSRGVFFPCVLSNVSCSSAPTFVV